jgi:hypothetical protein
MKVVTLETASPTGSMKLAGTPIRESFASGGASPMPG